LGFATHRDGGGKRPIPAAAAVLDRTSTREVHEIARFEANCTLLWATFIAVGLTSLWLRFLRFLLFLLFWFCAFGFLWFNWFFFFLGFGLLGYICIGRNALAKLKYHHL